MTDSDPVEFPPLVDPTPPQVEPEFARPAASATIGRVVTAFEALTAAVDTATETCASWIDEFWASSGYDKASVTAALEALAAIEADYSDDVAALAQAPA